MKDRRNEFTNRSIELNEYNDKLRKNALSSKEFKSASSNCNTSPQRKQGVIENFLIMDERMGSSEDTEKEIYLSAIRNTKNISGEDIRKKTSGVLSEPNINHENNLIRNMNRRLNIVNKFETFKQNEDQNRNSYFLDDIDLLEAQKTYFYTKELPNINNDCENKFMNSHVENGEQRYVNQEIMKDEYVGQNYYNYYEKNLADDIKNEYKNVNIISNKTFKMLEEYNKYLEGCVAMIYRNSNFCGISPLLISLNTKEIECKKVMYSEIISDLNQKYDKFSGELFKMINKLSVDYNIMIKGNKFGEPKLIPNIEKCNKSNVTNDASSQKKLEIFEKTIASCHNSQDFNKLVDHTIDSSNLKCNVSEKQTPMKCTPKYEMDCFVPDENGILTNIDPSMKNIMNKYHVYKHYSNEKESPSGRTTENNLMPGPAFCNCNNACDNNEEEEALNYVWLADKERLFDNQDGVEPSNTVISNVENTKSALTQFKNQSSNVKIENKVLSKCEAEDNFGKTEFNERKENESSKHEPDRNKEKKNWLSQNKLEENNENDLNKKESDSSKENEKELGETELNEVDLSENELEKNNNENELEENELDSNKENENELEENEQNEDEISENELKENNENELEVNESDNNEANENELEETELNKVDLSENEREENNENELEENESDNNKENENELEENEQNEDEISENELEENNINEPEENELDNNEGNENELEETELNKVDLSENEDELSENELEENNENDLEENEKTKDELSENELEENNENDLEENEITKDELSENELEENNENDLEENEKTKDELSENELEENNENELEEIELDNNKENQKELEENEQNEDELPENELDENNENDLGENELDHNKENENELEETELNKVDLSENELEENNENEPEENELVNNEENENELNETECDDDNQSENKLDEIVPENQNKNEFDENELKSDIKSVVVPMNSNVSMIKITDNSLLLDVRNNDADNIMCKIKEMKDTNSKLSAAKNGENASIDVPKKTDV